MEAIVEFDYAAQEEDELNLKIGDLITNVTKVSEGWCEGTLNGLKGAFPDNFVKMIKKEDVKEQPPHKKSNAPVVAELRNKLSSVIGGPSHQLPGKKIGNKKAKVTYQYIPQNEDELQLEIGQIIDVIRQEEPGWWEGNLNGKIGMFPSNFVEVVVDGHSKSLSSEDNAPEIKGRKVMGIGFGPNIFGQGGINLKPTGIGNRVQNDATKNVNPPAAHILPKKPVINANIEEKPTIKAKVLYSYAAENDDELSISIGDIITIIDQNMEDAGWWKGELNGKVGVFPDNFVEVIQEEKKKAVMPPNGVNSKQNVGPQISVDNSKVHKKEDKTPITKVEFPKPQEVPDKKEPYRTDTLNSVQSTELLSHLNANRVHGPPARKPPSLFTPPQKPIPKEEKKPVLNPPKVALGPTISKKKKVPTATLR